VNPLLNRLLEQDLIPDPLLRWGIRRRLSATLKRYRPRDPKAREHWSRQYIESLRQAPIAVETAAANEQHYEVPTAFFELCLGKHLKYSSGLYQHPGCSLDEAEAAMLGLTCERAELADGQQILELGCGWGSLSLWMAEHYPNAKITSVSNSRTQKQHIDAQAAKRGLTNLRIITANIAHFEDLPAAHFDRCVSVEMFEHMKNYQLLMRRIAGWLKPGGKLFVHIFTHHDCPYPFEVQGPDDWMAKYFFTGGQMPSDELLLSFQDDLKIEQHWKVNGMHYSLTSEAWLENMDRNKAAIMPLFVQTYGAKDSRRWWVWWRLFYLACAELWGYRGGEEWLVSHYRFTKP
jgi:cyclopropane-fatty-acyl-phospholipid synthase